MQTKLPCVECGKLTSRKHPILDTPLCRPCHTARQDKYTYITKTRAMQEFRLKLGDLQNLRYHSVDNPHYKTAAPMQLYLRSQIQELSEVKWGSKDPYVVGLRLFDRSMLGWLCEDEDRVKQLSPEQFQYLIADRLEQFGLGVQIVGNINRMDGGIDIIAYPNSATIPFLLAVQVKHHRVDRKTPVEDVREFHGVLTSRSNEFHIGMIVTNTTFTPHARFFAEHNKNILRLRDMIDLRRWLNDDFENPCEWREIPNTIMLAPGIEISIPRPKLILPPWYK